MRAQRWVLGSLLGCWLVGCTLTVDLDELENRQCPEGEKLCNDTCVSTKDPKYGCKAAGCSSCNLRYALAKCSEADGSCQIAACDGASRRDCDGVASNGCEADLAHDVKTCGTCTTVCTVPNGEPTCTASKCALLSCKNGFADCNSSLTDGCETSGSCK